MHAVSEKSNFEARILDMIVEHVGCGATSLFSAENHDSVGIILEYFYRSKN